MLRYLAVALTGALLYGCAVGPDFRTPAPPNPPGYTAAALPAETSAAPGTGGASQRFLAGRDIPEKWWELFHSPALDRLVQLAFTNNPTLAAAQAALREAQESRRAQLGVLLPQVDAGFTAERSKISGASFGQPGLSPGPFSLFDASVSVSYTLDLFGGARRELEALQAQADYQRFQVEGTYLSLSANIVTSAIREASLRAQLRTSREILKLLQQQLSVFEIRFQMGAVSEVEVLAQRVLLAQTMATLPPLEKELAQTRHQIAVLTGKFPNEAAGYPEFELEGLQLPEELPVSLPSALVRQRPDIRAAEELLHAASAEVGVATAALYPQITLSGNYGSEATRIASLFSSGSAVWSLGSGITQPLFHGGQLTAKRRAAIAAYEQAGAQYRAAVLQGFQNVADVLQALDNDAATLKAQADGVLAAFKSLELVQNQLQAGAVGYLSLLDADRQYQQARLNLVQAQATRYADTAALFQALGGGWWNREKGDNTQLLQGKPK
jgi:NodT family efflux transporter outer membrane factor (OMF) lipoprotein